jgi:phosphate starvation-inducible protein PhoH and related proteins
MSDRNNAKSFGQVIVKGRNGRAIKPKTQGQFELVDAIDSSDLLFVNGPAGTGKTFLAIAKAVQGLREGKYKKIILTRPVVQAGEDLGFLPGELGDKMAPYMAPFYESLHKLEQTYDSGSGDSRKPKKTQKDMQKGKKGAQRKSTRDDVVDEKEDDPWKGKIVVSPLAYMRGLTFEDAFVIMDEAQNVTQTQMELFLTRIGVGSKVVITGDHAQLDINGYESGFIHAQRVTGRVRGVESYTLTTNDIVRHRMVREIIGAYENDRNPKIHKDDTGVFRHCGTDDTIPRPDGNDFEEQPQTNEEQPLLG